MASLRFQEKSQLEEYLEMGSGYVLDFSNRTFAEFFRDFDIDIDGPQYSRGHSGSKANRMRSFWDSASDALVGRVLEELVKYAESYRPGHLAGDRCRAIARRLQTDEPQVAGGESDASGPAGESSVPRPEAVNSNVVPIAQPKEIFFSYAHEDEELMDVVRLQLVVREQLGEIVKWHDRKIPAGDAWRTIIDVRIERADVILLFMSPHFLASQYCYEIEGEVALRRHREGTARVIPVVLRPCDWTVTPFGELQALPKDGVPLTQWPDRDQASLDVARGIMKSLRDALGNDFK